MRNHCRTERNTNKLVNQYIHDTDMKDKNYKLVRKAISID